MQAGAGRPYGRLEREQAQAERAVAVEGELAARQMPRQPVDQQRHLLGGEIGQEPLRDDHRRAPAGHRLEPARLGHRRADQGAAMAGGIEPAAQRDHLRIVDLEPAHPRRRVDPEDAAVEPAAEMQHGGVRVARDEIAGPAVEDMGPQRQADHQVAIDPEPCEVIVDAADELGGETVLQQGIGQPAFARLAIERDQERFLLAGQRDLFGSHRMSPAVMLAGREGQQHSHSAGAGYHRRRRDPIRSETSVAKASYVWRWIHRSGRFDLIGSDSRTLVAAAAAATLGLNRRYSETA